MAADGSCQLCEEGSGGGVANLVIFVAAVLIVLICYTKRLYLFSKFQELEKIFVDRTKDIDVRSFKNKGKILFAFFQIISSMPTALNLAYPSPFDNMLKVSSFSNVNLVNLLSFGCVVDVNFYDELW